jgi:predicted MFS family arabinose efflux permease
MTTDVHRRPDPTVSWNIRQLYWDVFWFGILAGSTLTFQAVYAARLGATGLQIGLLSAGPAIISLFFTLPSGMWIEGKSLIRLSFRSAIWQRLGYVLLIALPWLFDSPEGQIWALIWVTLVMAVAGTVLSIAFNSLFAEVLPPERRAHAVGRRNVLLALSITIASLISGQILNRVSSPANYQVVFLIGAIGAMLSSFHIGRIRKSETVIQLGDLVVEQAGVPPQQTRRRALVRLDLLTGPFGIFMLSYLVFYTFQYFPIPLFPLAYVDLLSLTDGMIGIGNGLFYGTMILASFRLTYYSNRYGHRKVLIASAVMFPVFPLFLAMGNGPVMYYLACLTGGVVYALLTGAMLNRLMDQVPPDDRPAHMAIHNLALNVGILAGSMLGPVTADLIGLRPAVWLSAGLRLLAAVFFLLWG